MSRTNIDKICITACIILICLAFSITISATLTTKQVIGSDYYFHRTIAGYIATGQFTQAWNYTSAIIHFPYAFFAFHTIVLTPPTLIGQVDAASRLLQVLFLPLTFALCLFVAYKFGNPKAAVLTGLILIGCWSFTDGAIQVRPESLDLLLYPLMLYALMKTSKKTFASLSLLTVYSHGPAAIANIYGLVLNKIRNKEWQKTMLITIAMALPVIILSLLYIKGAFQQWGGVPQNENPQEYLVWTQPILFIPYYMGLTMIGVIFLFLKNKTPFEKIVAWGLIGSFIMFPIWADRWLHYAAMPLALLSGIGITRQSITKQILFATVIVMMAFFYYYNFLYQSANSLWWQPGL